MYKRLPLQDRPKFTQIGIFGLKICHLATLVDGRDDDDSQVGKKKTIFRFPESHDRVHALMSRYKNDKMSKND
jgi:hypothetical protein